MKKITIIMLLIMFSLGLTMPHGTSASGHAIATNDRVSFEVLDYTPTPQVEVSRPHVDSWHQSLSALDSMRSTQYEVIAREFTMPTFAVNTGDLLINGPPDPKKHNPIYIDSNRDLKKYSGSGTANDPKVIDSLYIENDRKPLIMIENTDLYITISNNYLIGLNAGFDGIVINNAAHVTIMGNEINSTNYGILVTNSYDVNIVGNIVYNNVLDGIALNQVTTFDVSDNTVYSNGGNGVLVTYGDQGTVTGNTLYSNTETGLTYAYTTNTMVSLNTIHDNGADGIFFIDSNGNTLYKNNVYHNGFAPALNVNGLQPLSFVDNKLTFNAQYGGSGIFLDPSADNNVIENAVSDNAGMGIYLLQSDDSFITGNTVTSNGYSGIFFDSSNRNTIADNQVHGNGNSAAVAAFGSNAWDLISTAQYGGSGIFLDPSFDNVITGNNVTQNAGDGIMLELSDRTLIDGNDVQSNGLSGVFFISSDSNNITNNVITGNGNTVAAVLASNAFASPYDMKVFAQYGGSGIFLDPSFDNLVEGNVLTGNQGNGVALLESDNTLIVQNYISTNGQEGVILVNSTQNEIAINTVTDNGYSAAAMFAAYETNDLLLHAQYGGSGIFLDPSPDNKITGNTISGNAASGIHFLDTDFSEIIGNVIDNNGADGIFFEDSNYNMIAQNAIEYNGASVALSGLGVNAQYGGSGIFLDPSVGNTLTLNNVTGHPQYGVYSEASGETTVTDNRVMSNGLYGIALDANSYNSKVDKNNFQQNDGQKSQAYDDGMNNAFAANFWDDNNNNDTNYDGIADTAYTIDGSSGSTDSTASNIPNGLNYYYGGQGTVTPTKINAGSDGTPVTMKVYLTDGDGYRALNVTPSEVFINGTVPAYDAHIIDILTFTVTFNRLAVNNLINNYAAANGLSVPFFIDLQVSGIINDGLLYFEVSDAVEINQIGEPTVPLAGLLAPLAVVPLSSAITKKKEEK